MSLYDINGGVLNASGGLLVGGNSNNGNNGQGNGQVNIQGSGIVNVSGGSGLQIGEDSALATSGSLDLSSGVLAVTGGVILGSGGGIGTLSRSGGSMTVTGGLTVGGNATIVLDATTANVATSFGGGLSRSGLGTLVVVPYTGNLATSESLGFVQAPVLTNGILGPWAVLAASGTNSSGDYLTTTGTGTKFLAKASYGTFASSGNSTVVLASSSSTLSGNKSAYAVNFGTATTTIGTKLTITSGGLILNGGIVTGGALSLANSSGLAIPALIYAGSSTPGTIASEIETSSGLVKFGPGTLVLSGYNSGLSGGISLQLWRAQRPKQRGAGFRG